MEILICFNGFGICVVVYIPRPDVSGTGSTPNQLGMTHLTQYCSWPIGIIGIEAFHRRHLCTQRHSVNHGVHDVALHTLWVMRQDTVVKLDNYVYLT